MVDTLNGPRATLRHEGHKDHEDHEAFVVFVSFVAFVPERSAVPREGVTR
jgi:hypothetical protein